MLTHSNTPGSIEGRSGAVWGLLALSAVLTAPARGDDKGLSPAAAPCFFQTEMKGAIVIRPAAAVRHRWVNRLAAPLSEVMGGDLGELQRRCKIHRFNKGQIYLECKDIEWLACRIAVSSRTGPGNRRFGNIHLDFPVVRTLAPFDWLTYLRQSGVEPTAVNLAGRVYYKLKAPAQSKWWPERKSPFSVHGFDSGACLYLADDRTAWFALEEHIKQYLSLKNPTLPAFLSGPEWVQASKGVLAVAFDNHEGSFLGRLDPRNPDDAVVLSILRDVERVTIAAADADELFLTVSADCRPGDASAGISRMIDVYAKILLARIEDELANDPRLAASDPTLSMAKGVLSSLRIVHTDQSVKIAGRFVDLDSHLGGRPKDQQAKADSKTLKR